MEIIELSKNNFEQEVLNSNIPVVIDFWAEWCGPCKMLAPILDEIAEEYPQYTIGKIDVDKYPSLASEFFVATIPNLVILEGGKVIRQISGAKPKALILKLLEE